MHKINLPPLSHFTCVIPLDVMCLQNISLFSFGFIIFIYPSYPPVNNNGLLLSL